MESQGYNCNSLSEAINKRLGANTTQGQLRRILVRESTEPRDSTLTPIATYFDLSVAQLKDYKYIIRWIAGTAKLEDEKRAAIEAINALVNTASDDQIRAIEKLLKSFLSHNA